MKETQQVHDPKPSSDDHYPAMFGCTREEVERFKRTVDRPASTAMSLLSDAQWMMGAGKLDEARHMINLAKFLLSDLSHNER